MTDVTVSLRNHFATAQPSGVISAYLFGSYARGIAHAESDVDVGVLLDRRRLLSSAARARVADALASDLIAALHRNAVDVVVLNDAAPELGAHAVSTGRRLYCADPGADHAFVRTTLLRHADLKPFLERTRRLKLRALAG